MTPIPLRLDEYFFTRIHVEANPEFTGESGAGSSVEVEPHTTLLKHQEDPTRYQVTVTVGELHTRDDAPLPYNLDVQAVGLFSVDSALVHDDIDRLVLVNGASMLYSALREHVLTVTGRGPWGAFQLPTQSFRGLRPPRDEEHDRQ